MKKSSDNARELQGNHLTTARLLGVTAEALRVMTRDRGCPVLKHGQGRSETLYDWIAVIRWMRKDLAAGRGDTKLTDARTALAAAQAAKVARENKLADGDLVSLKSIKGVIVPTLLAVRTRLLAIPTVIAPEIGAESDPSVCKAIMQKEIEDALTQISELKFERGAPKIRQGDADEA